MVKRICVALDGYSTAKSLNVCSNVGRHHNSVLDDAVEQNARAGRRRS